MFLFFKLDFDQVELDINNVEFHLNFQKNLCDKIYTELDIANVKFHQ